MKIKDAINMANLMEQGNVLPKELAILFLSELDGMIQSDIMLHAPEEIVSYDNEEQELLLRPPHDKLYVHYLVMMIRNQQQEYEGYQNTQASVDEKLKTFRRWYVQHYRPADTDSRSYMGGTSADAFGFAYLTAYGLAVRSGYQGTEEQWLESLHGAPGDPGEPARMRYDAERETIQWGVGDTWYDLFSLQALRDPVVAAFLREAEAAAQSALRSAEAANQAAGVAQSAVSQSQAAAEQAEAEKAAAAESAHLAGRAADSSADYATLAAASAGDAQAQAQTAGNHAAAAEAAAKRAEDAAASGGSGGGGISQESDPTVPAWAKEPQKPSYTAAEVGAEPAGTVGSSIEAHDVARYAHNDIRLELRALADRINAALNSTDTDLDQISEIVAYIKSNKSLIDAITTSKVSVADIVDNFTTDAADKPLSARVGFTLKNLLDLHETRYDERCNNLEAGKLDASKLPEAINTALAQAQASGAFDGDDGIGISGAEINENGELVITYSNDETVNLGRVVGEGSGGAGTPGKDGVGISETEINGEGHLVITYTDGKTVDLGNVIGAPGADGSAATIAIVSVAGLPSGSPPSITEAANSTAQNRKYILGIPRGEQGPAGADGKDGSPGEDGATGPQGPKGDSGVHILADGETLDDVPSSASVVIDPRGDGFGTQVFTFTLTDGSVVEMEVVARVV